eukprot:UN34163
MHSKAKPIMVQSYFKDDRNQFQPLSRFLLKAGDDTRQDAAVLHLFRFCNYIWSKRGVEYEGITVQTLAYKVLPITKDVGIIEAVDKVLPLKNILDHKWKDKNGYKDKYINRLVASSAASYIATVVLGVRDRHFDNVLVKDDVTLFHIDFGHCFGDNCKVETHKFAITEEFKKILDENNKWNDFVNLCLYCSQIPRFHYRDVI